VDPKYARACSSSQREFASHGAVSVLVGQYDLWRGEWPTGPVVRLTERETQTLAHDDAAWHDPENAACSSGSEGRGLAPLSRPASTHIGTMPVIRSAGMRLILRESRRSDQAAV
jgi:hypothetical protein